jgi:hypothetical protein
MADGAAIPASPWRGLSRTRNTTVDRQGLFEKIREPGLSRKFRHTCSSAAKRRYVLFILGCSSVEKIFDKIIHLESTLCPVRRPARKPSAFAADVNVSRTCGDIAHIGILFRISRGRRKFFLQLYFRMAQVNYRYGIPRVRA